MRIPASLVLAVAMTGAAQTGGATAAPLEPGVSRTLAAARAKQVGAVRYDLQLTLGMPIERAAGVLEVRFTLADPGADLVLDWRQPAGRLDDIEANGVAVPEARIENEHLIIPAARLVRGENVVRMRFATPVAAAGTAVTRYRDREDGAEYVYSLLVPADASSVFPCFDQPDLKANFRLALTIPADWEAVSNSAAIETTVAGAGKRIDFATTETISTYLFAFAAGPWIALGETGESVRLYVRKSRAARARLEAPEVLRLNRAAIRYFEDYFGFAFPFGKYDLVLIPEFPYGGMEHAGATFLREEAVVFPSAPNAGDRLRRAQLIFHEASHQWFGDLVTMRWFDDLWLKEGFANFMAAKATAALAPEFPAWGAFHALKTAAYRTDVTRGTTPIYQDIPNLAAAKSAYGSIVYSKAPAILRQAEFYLGESAFRRAVRGLIRQRAYGTADWQDLVRAFERASGKRLGGWADAWVKRRGLADVRVDWQVDTANRITRFEIVQSDALGEGGAWPMRIELLLHGEGAPRILPVTLRGRRTRVAALVGTPAPRFVFANHRDYGYGRFFLDDRSRAAVLEGYASIADPLLRTLLASALWDDVREATLAPVAYIEHALGSLATEPDEIAAAAQIGRITTAYRWYLSDAHRAAVAPRIESAFAAGMLKSPEAGFRITWFRAFTAIATTADGRSLLKALLAGERQIPGVPLASRDRFRIIEALLAAGDAEGGALLAAQAAADDSNDGRRYAYAAAAAEPDPLAKARYFTAWRADPALAESWIEASLGPFNTVTQAALTAPYLEPALAALPELKRSRKIFFVNDWLAAFIGGQKTPESLAIVARFLGERSLDADLRLKVLEAADGLARTVRIRAMFAQ